ncbi:MAG: hypothetical protein M3P30_02870 [Chloroflexota bacterium]|nr:hypothetical protein [Chloroflexota bacterium]
MIADFTRRHLTLVSLGALLVAAAFVRMPFWLSSTYAYGHGDAITWEVWSRAIYDHGFINVFRTADSNYVGYHYVLWPTSIIYGWISPEYELWTAPIRILIKVPPFVCDLGLAAMIFFLARDLSTARTEPGRHAQAALAAAAFTLAPASVYDSMWWSQIDSVITLCMLGSVMLMLRGRIGTAWALWMLGFLFKPQPIVILPVLAAFTFWKYGSTSLLRGVACAVAVGLAALAPFLLHGDAGRIGGTYQTIFQQDPIDLSEGAWNGWSILDLHGDDPHPVDTAFTAGGIDVSYAELSLALSAAATLLVLAYLRRHLDTSGVLFACAAMVFIFFILPTSTHERYLYPLFAFAAPLLVRSSRIIAVYVLLSVTFTLNLLAINPPNASDFWQWHETPFAVAIAAMNIAVFCALMMWLMASMIPRAASVTRRLSRPEALAEP